MLIVTHLDVDRRGLCAGSGGLGEVDSTHLNVGKNRGILCSVVCPSPGYLASLDAECKSFVILEFQSGVLIRFSCQLL